MPVSDEKDLQKQIQDAKEMFLMILELDKGEIREMKGIMTGYQLAKQIPA